MMAFQRSAILSARSCLGYQHTWLSVSSLRAALLTHHTPVCNHRREYRKFSRTPIAVNPARQDQGKMDLGEYVDRTSKKVNEEVLAEMASLKQFTESRKQGSETSFDAFKSPAQRKRKCDTDDIDRGKYDSSSSFETSGKKKIYIEEDPEIRRVLKIIKSEFYDKAPALFRKLLMKCASSKYRDEEDIIMLEGPKLIREAILSGLAPEAVYFTRKKLLLEMMPRDMSLEEQAERVSTFRTYVTSYKKLNTWSSVVNGQGIVALFRQSTAAAAPRLQTSPPPSHSVRPPVTVLLDCVREPGNLGAILRTVAAVGVSRLVLIKGCCDPWDSKALRAACGGHFSVHITKGVRWRSVYSALPRYPAVFVADVCNSDREAMQNNDDPAADPDQYDDETQSIMEAIDFKRQSRERRLALEEEEKYYEEYDAAMSRGEKHAPSAAVEERKPADLVIEIDGEGNEIITDESFDDADHVSKYSEVTFPTNEFNEMDYFPVGLKDEIVLVIGGETGLSHEAKKFVADNYGQQISIPLMNGIDSLNTSVATGVILYEVRRQANQHSNKLENNNKKSESLS